MIDADNTEPFYGSKDRHDAWISEAIWGHRLERQPLSALMLEFLGMAEGMFREGKLLTQTRPSENPEYTANRSLHLRNLLFNNPANGGNPPECTRQRRGGVKHVAASN